MINFFKKKSDRPNRILVTGVGKTGSTALFHAILNSLPAETVSIFEPESRGETLPEDIKPPVLVKSFIPYSENFNFFEKKILLVRDPRDQLISEMLYRPYKLLSRKPSEENPEDPMVVISAYLDLVKKKEASPWEVPLKELFDMLPVGVPMRINYMTDYAANHPDAFLLKYEDFVDQKLKRVNRYLGFEITGAVEVPDKYNRVIRTKSYGNWRNWFTPADVEHFRPIMKVFMKRFGYRDCWKLNNNPVIDPHVGSLYLEKVIGEALKYRKEKGV